MSETNEHANEHSEGVTNADQRQWAAIAHFSALVGFLVPFGNVIGPLVVWQIKKDEMPFVVEQAKEALNFHITVTIAVFVCLLLMVVLVGFLLLPIVGLVALILTIVAGIKASGGEHYRYPFTLRLVS
ncbi:MAG: DUF4870 domain-containing protein [Pseudomonadota bacterium]